MLAYKAEPPKETAWKEVNKISRIISNSDTIRFHTNNFIYKTLTNIKQGEQIPNTIEITHMA